jgi:NodT family efflux transporter outer membrane factor (OMF) lipoprotein
MVSVARALVLVSLLAAGCAVGPNYVRPADPLQTTYVGPGSGTADQAGAPESTQSVALGKTPPDDWWTLLGSEQLDRLVKLALANNQSLASAQAHLQAARERIGVARGAQFPQVDAATSAQRTRIGATVLGSQAKDFPSFSAYAGGVEVSYDLDLFGGTRRRIEHAGAEAQYQTALRDAAALSISGNVVLQALQIASSSEQIRVVEAIVADDERMLRLINAANAAGAVSRMDVLSAQSQTDHDRTLLPPLRQQLSVAQDALAILVGAAPDEWPAQNVNLQQITLQDEIPAVLPSELVHRRPDIAAAEAQLHAASASVGIATANLYPHLTLDGSVGREGLLAGGPSEIAWNVLGGLTEPIFHGGALNAEKRAAARDYQAAFGAYRETVLEAFGQVADTLQALKNDREALSTQQRALESARASLELTRQGYQGGNAGYVQVLDAQRLHQEAQLGTVHAETQSYVDAVKLVLAAGGRVDDKSLDAVGHNARVSSAIPCQRIDIVACHEPAILQGER